MQASGITDLIFQIANAHRMTMRAALNASDLGLNRMHVSCLSYIYQNDNSTANDLVLQLGRDKAQIARLVKEMVEKNWLDKAPNPNDKRSQLLVLTDEGKQLAEKIREVRESVKAQMAQQLTEQELAEFMRIGNKIAGSINID